MSIFLCRAAGVEGNVMKVRGDCYVLPGRGGSKKFTFLNASNSSFCLESHFPDP